MSVIRFNSDLKEKSTVNVEAFNKTYKDTVLNELESIPGKREYKVAALYTVVQDKKTGDTSIKHDIEVIDPSGDRLNASNVRWLKNKAVMEKLIKSGYVQKSDITRHYAFQVTIDHLYRQHKVLDNAVFIVSLNRRQLKVLNTIE